MDKKFEVPEHEKIQGQNGIYGETEDDDVKRRQPQNGNPEEVVEGETIHVYKKWEEYELKEELLRGIFALGFDRPSFIQSVAIKPILQGHDVRAQAQSGTGKTAAFGISALQKLTGLNETEIMILVTTREMADQNAQSISKLAVHMNVKTVIVAGGRNVGETVRELHSHPHIVVGTPGRVFHMIKEKHLDTRNIKLFIIDEADEMLKLGFNEQLQDILEYIPLTAQIGMFSATWEADAIEVADKILENPIVIDLRHDEQTLKGIDQYYVDLGVEPHRKGDFIKVESLFDIYKRFSLAQCVVFVNTRNKAKFVHKELTSRGIPCNVIHADLDQKQRQEVLNEFRSGSARLLIATSVIARGIDIHQLSVVFNFDIPPLKEKNDYIHRIGRAGRYGRKGVAINLVFQDECAVLNEIEKHYNTSIIPFPNLTSLG